MAGGAVLLAGLLAVTSFAPGFFAVRRLAFVFHWTNTARWIYAAACLFATIGLIPQLRLLFSTRQVRRAGAGFAIVLLWTFLLLSLARHYSGGPWSGDWIIHYQKSLAFLSEPTAARQLLDRPPAMNLIWSYYLALAGD